MLIIITIATVIATFFGGLFALRFKDKLHVILGFSAGAVIGVAFFDLMPEALELGTRNFALSTMAAVIALGFILYMIIDRTIALHSHEEQDGDGGHAHTHDHGKQRLGAGSLSFHSFLDGVAIGLAFHVSSVVGIVVAIAVIAHDFSDGINTVNMVLRNGGKQSVAFRWLIVDAVAPVLGVLASFIFAVTDSVLGVLLALFCGFFLYIGASDLLPESHHNHPTRWTTFMTVLGVVLMFVIIRLASI